MCPTCMPLATKGAVVVGGWSAWRDATLEITSIGSSIRSFLEPKRKFASFVVKQYREQLVSGTNYILKVQADDFDLSFDVYKSTSGDVQIKTPTGSFPLRAARGICPRKCTKYSTGEAREPKCGRYVNGFGLCGDASDWGPGFLEKKAADMGPFVDCTRC